MSESQIRRGLIRAAMPVVAVAIMLIPSKADAQHPVSASAASRRTQFDHALVWLKSDRVLGGQVTIGATELTVSSGSGVSESKIQVPVSRVRGISTTTQSLYRHVRSTKQLASPRQFYEFGQWCCDNELQSCIEILIAEAELAFANDRAWTRWRDRLNSRLLVDQSPSMVQLASFESAGPGSSFPSEHGFAPERPFSQDSFSQDSSINIDDPAFQFFVRKVQPVLLGRCRHCHDNGQGQDDQSWSLRWDSNLGITSAVSRENFAATVRRCNQDASGDSAGTLLEMATSVHGDLRQAPLGKRHGDAIKNLQDWIQFVTASQQTSVAAGLTKISSLPKLRRPGASSPDLPTRLPIVSNPTDANIFNRETDAIKRVR